MAVMEAAFDPKYGEAWNRRQVGDALVTPNTRFVLLDVAGGSPDDAADAAGFTLSRQTLDEEELLLIAVAPWARRRGVGHALMRQFLAISDGNGVTRQFLEMRAGNPAEALYLAHGFAPVGRRPNYYRSGNLGPFDAITYSRTSS
ncbi:GNAT family N-acetyltransferase [Altererythrobacter buctensis]|uniref:GNAT family N-acetyltransferase n=2 Tax=Alteraurantiacibacter buctensis TaxID=1503981 RepID=A0A844Z063_9SPHN|nr:GNAT family N-acetyltransferase [Alteraurantiacibacter buctensis]